MLTMEAFLQEQISTRWVRIEPWIGSFLIRASFSENILQSSRFLQKKKKKISSHENPFPMFPWCFHGATNFFILFCIMDVQIRVRKLLSIEYQSMMSVIILRPNSSNNNSQSNVNALIDMKLEKHKNLREESAFYWREIVDGTLKFDRRESEVKAWDYIIRWLFCYLTCLILHNYLTNYRLQH